MNIGRADNQYANWVDYCSVDLSEVLTRWGLCHTFNLMHNASDLLNFEELSGDFCYNISLRFVGLTLFNVRTVDCVHKTNILRTTNHEIGLSMELRKVYKKRNFPDDIYRRFKSPFEINDGFHLIFHSPDELPSIDSIHHYTVSNSSLLFWIRPELTIYDESMMDDSSDERNCYKEDEKKLKFFNIYNQHNCEQECLSNFTFNQCQCVQFFMMREWIFEVFMF